MSVLQTAASQGLNLRFPKYVTHWRLQIRPGGLPNIFSLQAWAVSLRVELRVPQAIGRIEARTSRREVEDLDSKTQVG